MQSAIGCRRGSNMAQNVAVAQVLAAAAQDGALLSVRRLFRRMLWAMVREVRDRARAVPDVDSQDFTNAALHAHISSSSPAARNIGAYRGSLASPRRSKGRSVSTTRNRPGRRFTPSSTQSIASDQSPRSASATSR